MGACFSKVFNACPLQINCTATWTNPETKDQHIIVGAEEGIFSLNLNELHEAAMDQIHPRRCTWVYVMKDVLMAVQGGLDSFECVKYINDGWSLGFRKNSMSLSA